MNAPSNTGVGDGLRRKWAALAVLAAGVSLIVIDGTIVGVALPVVVEDLHLTLGDAQWVNSLYSVVFAALLLTSGRLGDRLGRKRLFMVGVVVFVAGSLLASAATGAGALITARAVQGVGGAAVLPATLSTVNAVFRGKDRVIAFAVWGSVISGMAAIGPLLGGWLTTSFSWPWIFLVNLPIGILLLVGTWLFVPETQAKITERGVDVDGLLLSAMGFGALIFALIEGSTLGWWTPKADFAVFGMVWPKTAAVSPVPVLAVVGLLLLGLFVLWERHRGHNGRSAILDLTLFRTATFSWGNITAMMVAIGEFGLLFVLPLFLVNVLGLNTMGAGLVLAAMALGAFASGGMARHLAARLGSAKVVVLGLVLEVVGVIAVGLFVDATVSGWLLALLLVIYGAGLGLASAQLTGTTLADIPAERSGQGSATQSTVRQLGSALGTALIGAVLSLGVTGAAETHLAAAGQSQPAARQLATAARDSAGGVIAGLRDKTPAGQGDPVVHALSAGFAEATGYAMFAAALFLVLGLAASAMVVSSERRDRDA